LNGLFYAVLGYSFKGMFAQLFESYQFLSSYEATPLVISHWYEWIFAQKPLWYMLDEYQKTGQFYAIVCIANYLFWFSAEIIMIASLFFIKKFPKLFYLAPACIVLQFAFWTFKPTTHLYYMYSALPFYAIALSTFVYYLSELYPDKAKILKIDSLALLLCCGIIFGYYYPLVNGKSIAKEKVERYVIPENMQKVGY